MCDAQKAPAPSAETERAVEVLAEKLTGAAPRLLRTLVNNEFVGVHCSKPVTLRAAGELFEYRLVEKLRPAVDGLVIKHSDVTELGRLVARSLKGEG